MSEDNTKPVEDATTPAKSVLDEVVELKGNEKFKDPEVLAKSVLAGDAHIKNLERQLEELRSELSNRMTAEEAMKAIDAKAKEFAEMSRTTGEQVTTDLDPEKVEAIVNSALEKRVSEEKAKANAEEVNRRMAEAYGDEAVNAIKTRATELGMAVDKMVGIARENPNAFMALMGQPSAKSTNKVASTQVNTASQGYNKEPVRDYAFYEKIRRENPVEFFSPKVQRQYQKDMVSMGERFLSKE